MIPLFSYFNVFHEGKLRPGFVIQDKLFVLTSLASPDAVATERVSGDHFQTVTFSYLTMVKRVKRQIPAPYNNVCSGFLPVSDEVINYLVQSTGLSLTTINSYFLKH